MSLDNPSRGESGQRDVRSSNHGAPEMGHYLPMERQFISHHHQCPERPLPEMHLAIVTELTPSCNRSILGCTYVIIYRVWVKDSIANLEFTLNRNHYRQYLKIVIKSLKKYLFADIDTVVWVAYSQTLYLIRPNDREYSAAMLGASQ
jgi:hypothetical protein